MRAIVLIAISLAVATGNVLGQVRKDRPTGLARTILSDSLLNWSTTSTPHYRIHFLAESFAANHLRILATGLEKSHAEALKTLGETEYLPRVDVFFFTSVKQAEPFVKMASRGYADPESRTVLNVDIDSTAPINRFDIMQVLSYSVWGPPNDSGAQGFMLQGLAMLAAGSCGSQTIDELAANICETGKAIPIDSLVANLASHPGLRSRIQAASFIGHLIDTYGPPKVRQLWSGGFHKFTDVFDKSPASIDKEWRSKVSAAFPKASVDWRRLDVKGCP
jgi:hypothetical protein